MTERVADYPRPPRLERDVRRVRVVFDGETIVDTRAAWRVLETFHPPTFYLPMDAFEPESLVPGSSRRSFCEWKGVAAYFSIKSAHRAAADCAWGYPEPSAPFAALKGHVALYAGAMDVCMVDDEVVAPQPGGFYGGWITSELVGPFKGGPGTEGW